MALQTTVVIVTYNAIQWISKCLNSIGNDYPVVIVDNNSTDNTTEFIQSNFPKTQIISQEVNMGFGQANNIGISKAIEDGAQYVFLMNQDVYLEKDCLQKLIEFHKSNTQFGILSPVHLNGEGNKIDSLFFKHTSIEYNPDFYSDFVTNNSLREVYEFPYVNAAAWLISKECIETVGGFDPIFFHYGEDHDYCNRLRYHGFKIGILPLIYIKHDRENRKVVRFPPFSNEHLKFKERMLKTRYTDINKNEVAKISYDKGLTRKNLMKNLFLLKINRVRFYWEEKKMLERITGEILNSRKINKIKGKHYLNIERK
ncbi:glycosyltransferase family 2 protein [Gramella sp. KN1008]|uniref:glycosyltransferase family 2 protein n=1 Tax=Gramella sp. KN1008 TaxID=2529298 RepID=UPI0010401422|nr:glycosyltransferase family 2 protein [Gramella sp. KN1008]TBW25558.1 glycosyltransferase family 2 protein [Gramella sp. KN1008]